MRNIEKLYLTSKQKETSAMTLTLSVEGKQAIMQILRENDATGDRPATQQDYLLELVRADLQRRLPYLEVIK